MVLNRAAVERCVGATEVELGAGRRELEAEHAGSHDALTYGGVEPWVLQKRSNRSVG